MISIMLVDDHPVIGEGSKLIIEKEDDMEVTIADSPGKAIEILKDEDFTIMLFDLRMDGMNGIELTKQVRSMGKTSPILIYTGHDVGPYFNTLMEAGVTGFISKTASREELIQAIRYGIEDKAIVPVSLLEQLRKVEIRVHEKQKNSVEQTNEVSISSKEQDILTEVAKGKSNKEIAECFFKSPRTIEYHLTEIFKKLRVKTRAEAVLKSKQLGVITEDIK
ncbi:response regulator transcription factor [Gracilibacillus caseinilyticus]|uniref:Response regulator transcription factor n=1 Tax=Gracilibacillus caseinilyticus TaxID=2932256 RepID=A0ABY4EXW6_9BACI|nr:response regulator transcription factor [Gracilibacillus caseinilyticus]UOQ49125.1 response regulator transcription factor [Gracilibacillus caseinilyticus]